MDTNYLMAVSKMQGHLNSIARILNECRKAGEIDAHHLTRLVRVIDSYNDEAAGLSENIWMNLSDHCDKDLINRYRAQLDEALFGGDGDDGDVHSG